MRIYEYLVFAIFMGISGNSLSQTVINGLSMPESVISDGERYFVSNLGQDVFSKDGDGFISEITADGKIVNLKFAPLEGILDAPKGMAIDQGVIYVTDLDRIIGFHLVSGKTLFELKINGAKSLNDLTSMGKGYLGVTDPETGNIYRVSLKDDQYTLLTNIPSVNGISYNERTKQVAVCTMGKNYGDGSVWLAEGSSDKLDFKQLKGIGNGFFDGIEWMDDKMLLVSDWVTFPVKGFGKLWIYDLKKHTSKMRLTGESSADLFYDRAQNKIYIPQTLHNRVLITDWEKEEDFSGVDYQNFYQYGNAESFIGGVFKGDLSLSELKLKGNFGLGAPDMLDGELTLVDGIAYQTFVSGVTKVMDNDQKTPFSFVTFFKADTMVHFNGRLSDNELYEKILSGLVKKNQPYAIRISGKFKNIKTRAFPRVTKQPFKPLNELLEQQTFFNKSDIEGDLIGFFMPSYLNGINISGLHFHFISGDKKSGGHVINFEGSGFKVEIGRLKNIEVETPDDRVFNAFDFSDKVDEALEKVERGN